MLSLSAGVLILLEIDSNFGQMVGLLIPFGASLGILFQVCVCVFFSVTLRGVRDVERSARRGGEECATWRRGARDVERCV